MLSCLGARNDTFPKGSRLLRAGDAVESKWVLCWRAAPLLCRRTSGGTATFSPKSGPGQTFAAVFACAPGAVLNVSVDSGERR